MATINDEIEQKIAKIKRPGESPLRALNRVLSEALEDDNRDSEEAARAREALRQGNSISDAENVDFRRTRMDEH